MNQNNFQNHFEDFTFGGTRDDDDNPDLDSEDSDEFSYQFANDELLDYKADVALKQEEQEVIDICQDEELKKLLILNRSKHIMLCQLFWKVKKQLKKCNDDENLQVGKSSIVCNKTSKMFKPILIHLGAPYFKTKKLFPAPLNADTIKKSKNNELTIYDLGSCSYWTINASKNLLKVVCTNYNSGRQKNMIKKIVELHNALKDESSANEKAVKLADEIAACENTLKYLEEVGSDDVPPLKNNDYIDWERISDLYYDGRHSAEECKAFWHLYLHPHINKSVWTNEENALLTEIASEYSYQDWDAIAEELDTGRSGFSTCLHFYTNLCDKNLRRLFTPEEDELLLEVTDNLKIGSYIPWKSVEQYFPNRNRMQLLRRYKYFLSKKSSLFGHFTEAEDVLILILVERFGTKFVNFNKYMPHRTHVQIKSRYSNMKGGYKKGMFSLDEDKEIIEYGEQIERGNPLNWNDLCKKMNRGRKNIRQRYISLKKFLQKNPGCIEKAPRRKFIWDQNTHKNNYEFLRWVAKQFKDWEKVPTVQDVEAVIQNALKADVKKKLKTLETSASVFIPCDDVDEELTEYFTMEERKKTIPWDKMDETAENIFEILKALKIDLKIPTDIIKDDDFILDNADLEILKTLSSLFESNISNHCSNLDKELIPANFNTLVGLKHLFMKKICLKQPFCKSKDSDNKMLQNLFTLPDLQNFKKNFNSLFLWPALFSLMQPSVELLEEVYGKDFTVPGFQKHRQKSLGVKIALNQCSARPPIPVKSVPSYVKVLTQRRWYSAGNVTVPENTNNREEIYLPENSLSIPSSSKDTFFLGEEMSPCSSPDLPKDEDVIENKVKSQYQPVDLSTEIVGHTKRSCDIKENDASNKKKARISLDKSKITVINNVKLNKSNFYDIKPNNINDNLNTCSKIYLGKNKPKVVNIPNEVSNSDSLKVDIPKQINLKAEDSTPVPFKITIPKNVKNLKKVDKSVIEKLINNGKKPVIFNLQNVQLGNEIQTIIQPVKDVNKLLKPSHSKEIDVKKLKTTRNSNFKTYSSKIKKQESTQSSKIVDTIHQKHSQIILNNTDSNAEFTVNAVKNSDEIDIEKLDAFLESVKNE